MGASKDACSLHPLLRAAQYLSVTPVTCSWKSDLTFSSTQSFQLQNSMPLKKILHSQFCMTLPFSAITNILEDPSLTFPSSFPVLFLSTLLWNPAVHAAATMEASFWPCRVDSLAATLLEDNSGGCCCICIVVFLWSVSLSSSLSLAFPFLLQPQLELPKLLKITKRLQMVCLNIRRQSRLISS
eukprot:TRINITY_DN7238_c0_g1_i10.p1 TRINITY_DN7238_c0_g1~~TRINITY_DN7238_c0_g1_i10.p1  ORF type:complete len:184 (-),score=25.07 TRINITY_DN7238_c0_g1_i10:1121-1672(-)